ncbi:MAG: hypothetical protein ACT443_02445 [Gemmatimonadota bacterium]
MVGRPATWSAGFTVNGTTLNVTNWFDSYHQAFTSTSAAMNGNSFTVAVFGGDDAITFTGTFRSGNPTRVDGTLNGPVCPDGSGRRLSGTWQGTRTGN